MHVFTRIHRERQRLNYWINRYNSMVNDGKIKIANPIYKHIERIVDAILDGVSYTVEKIPNKDRWLVCIKELTAGSGDSILNAKLDAIFQASLKKE